MSGQVTPL